MDLYFWYDSAFGSPVARVQGLGYLQELVSRLTHTPIERHNSSTNATWHKAETWPLNDALYVDATHEVVVLNGKFSSPVLGDAKLTSCLLHILLNSHHRAQFDDTCSNWTSPYRPHSGESFLQSI